MRSSPCGVENTNHGQGPFMETHNTPSIFSVSYHHLHYHHRQEPHITYGQPQQELPAMFQIDRREHEEEEQQFGHHVRAEEAALQSQPRDHHQAPLPFVNVNFKLGLSEKSAYDPSPRYSMSSEAQVHVPQQDYYSTLKEPSWRIDVSGDLNTYNRKCNEIANKGYALFGELEAVCNLGKTREMNQPRTSAGVTAENSPQILRLTAIKNLNVGPHGVNHRCESSKAVSTKKAERRRKRKLKGLTSTSLFFEALLKQVMDHQDFLHRKFLEVIERMERERIEREEEWRRQEARKHESEASLRAQERALASSRDALIVTYIEKITGQNPNVPKN